MIGHLKNDFRPGRSFLRGVQGDAMNLLPAATAANLSLWPRRVSACPHAILGRLLFASVYAAFLLATRSIGFLGDVCGAGHRQRAATLPESESL